MCLFSSATRHSYYKTSSICPCTHRNPNQSVGMIDKFLGSGLRRDLSTLPSPLPSFQFGPCRKFALSTSWALKIIPTSRPPHLALVTAHRSTEPRWGCGKITDILKPHQRLVGHGCTLTSTNLLISLSCIFRRIMINAASRGGIPCCLAISTSL